MFNALVDRIQAKFPPAKAAAALGILVTPLIASASGWLATWVPTHFPAAPHFTGAQLTALAVSGFIAGAGASIKLFDKRIDGWQKHEARVGTHNDPDTELWLAEIEAETKKVVALIAAGHVPESVMHLLSSAAPGESQTTGPHPVVPPQA